MKNQTKETLVLITRMTMAISVISALIWVFFFYSHTFFYEREKVVFDTNISLPKGYSARYASTYEQSFFGGFNDITNGYILYKGSCSDRILMNYDRSDHPNKDVISMYPIQDFGNGYEASENDIGSKKGICVETDLNGKTNLYVSSIAKKVQEYNSTVNQINEVIAWANKAYASHDSQKAHKQSVTIAEKQKDEQSKKSIERSWDGK
jgi:hypothetical protein